MAAQGWLDIHGHFFPPRNEEEKKNVWRSMREACFLASEPFGWEPGPIISYLDRAGIGMQMLSYIPASHDALRAANDHLTHIVNTYPTRFGLLAALPTDSAEACMVEVDRANNELAADGFAVSTVYNGVNLGDPLLNDVYTKLNAQKATVFIHPNAYAAPVWGKPSPLVEVAFDTARTAVQMLYNGVFRRYPDICFVLAHCGGALPALSGRLLLLGTEEWVPNEEHITKEEIKEQLGRLYVDTAATADTGLPAALSMVDKTHVVYGADCGVPCSTERTMETNRKSVLDCKELGEGGGHLVGKNGWALFPSAEARAAGKASRHVVVDGRGKSVVQIVN